MDTMTSKFKHYNAAWVRAHVTVKTNTDTRWKLNAFRTQLPDASLMICLFHTLRTFKRETATDKMGITAAQRDNKA